MDSNTTPIVSYKEEKQLIPRSGYSFLIGGLLLLLASVVWFVFSVIALDHGITSLMVPAVLGVITAIACWVTVPILLCGLKTIEPNEAAVYVLFGSYYGTISKPGFFWINPFCSSVNPTVVPAGVAVSSDGKATATAGTLSKKISMKAITLNNDKQKVNDREGNPIEIGVIVIWKVFNATKAVFEVDNYKTYVSTQTDASIRQVARQYPYDISEDGDEKSLRGSSSEVAAELKRDLQGRVEMAGIEIIEARIAHLAYAPEIAAAMLQRQQASAIIAARQKIVEGAVGMVEMALNKLSENHIVTLDDERKAAMVSNLLVVLCGNKDAQPIVNSGTIY
ncbi:MAG: SPFH domain-containing protein [Angelakisella sp.]